MSEDNKSNPAGIRETAELVFANEGDIRCDYCGCRKCYHLHEPDARGPCCEQCDEFDMPDTLRALKAALEAK